jgi:glycosyltransferase involved in cell wall biosynthesis
MSNFKFKRNILLNLVYIPTALPTIILSKIFKVKNCVLVPDISTFRFSYVTSSNKLHQVSSYIKKSASEFFDHKFDSYILLTKYMSSLVNKNERPYLVIEGMIEADDTSIDDKSLEVKDDEYIMYAGSLRKKYGIMKLIEAFRQIEETGVKLYIFGSGDAEKDINRLSKENNNIVFKGLVPQSRVFAYEKRALFLVNPRPSNEEFTKYSFPSKTIEYMSSGTPVITTRLKGIPDEYDNYLTYIRDESIEGFKDILEECINKKSELENLGISARSFVKNEKNHIVQSKKIAMFLKNLG